MKLKKTKAPQFKVSASIPVPARKGGRKSVYPFGTMKLKETFFVQNTKATREAVSSAASLYGQRHDMKFRTAQELNGTRVWRIA